MWQHHPSHVVRRWFLDSAPFLPLAARDEVRHALSRYDGAAWWPTEDMPFSRYFATDAFRSEEHTSELQSQSNLVCRLLLEKKKTIMAVVPGLVVSRLTAAL